MRHIQIGQQRTLQNGTATQTNQGYILFFFRKNNPDKKREIELKL